MGYGPLDSGLNLLGACMLVLHVAAFVDVLARPQAVFPAVDKQTKQLWMILLGVAVAWGILPMLLTQEIVFNSIFNIIGIAGTIVALVYLLDVRPAVKAAGGRGPGKKSGPRGGW
ncbi:MAG: DUF2516 family protein [Sporichthyaceae bacterium]